MAKNSLFAMICCLMCFFACQQAYADDVLDKNSYRGSPAQVSCDFDSLGDYPVGKPVVMYVTVTGENTKDHASNVNLGIAFANGSVATEVLGTLQNNPDGKDIGMHTAKNVQYEDFEGETISSPESNLKQIAEVVFDVGELREGERATYAIKFKVTNANKQSRSPILITNRYTLASNSETHTQSIQTALPIDLKTTQSDGCTQNDGWHSWVVDESSSENVAPKCNAAGTSRLKCRYCGKAGALAEYPPACEHSYIRPNGTPDPTIKSCEWCNTQNPNYGTLTRMDNILEVKSTFGPSPITVDQQSYMKVTLRNTQKFALTNINCKVKLPSELTLAASSFGEDGRWGNTKPEMFVEVQNGNGASINLANRIAHVEYLEAPDKSFSGGDDARVITLYVGYKCVKVNSQNKTSIGLEVSSDNGTTHTFEIEIPLTPQSLKDHTDADHVWGKGVQTLAPSCYQEGVMTYECTICHKPRTERIDKIPHDFGADGKDPYCAVCHTTNPIYGKLDHNPIWKSRDIIKPDCTHSGKVEQYCAYPNCPQGGTHASKIIYVPASGHSKGGYVEENKVEATCSKEGSYTKVWYCVNKDCHEKIAFEDTIIPKLAHQWISGKCSVCGITRAQDTQNHTHTWSEWTINTPATCTTMGKQTRKCTSCGKVQTKSVDMLKHKYGTDFKCIYCGEEDPTHANPDRDNPLPNPAFDLKVTPSADSVKIGEEFTVKVRAYQVVEGAQRGITHIVAKLTEGLQITDKQVPITGLDSSTTTGSVASRGKGFDIATTSFPATSEVTLEFKVKATSEAIKSEDITIIIDSDIDGSDKEETVSVAISDGADGEHAPVDLPADMSISVNPAKVTNLGPNEPIPFQVEAFNKEPASTSGKVVVEGELPEGLTLSVDETGKDRSITVSNYPDSIPYEVSISKNSFAVTFDRIEFGLHPIIHVYAKSTGSKIGNVQAKFSVTPENGKEASCVSDVSLIEISDDQPPVKPEDIVDKSSLQSLVTYAKSKDASQYSDESWEQMIVALNKAEEVLIDGNATTTDIRSAGESLYIALKALQPKTTVSISMPFELTLSDDFDSLALDETKDIEVILVNTSDVDYVSPVIVTCDAEAPLEVKSASVSGVASAAAEPINQISVDSFAKGESKRFVFSVGAADGTKLDENQDLNVLVSVTDENGSSLIDPKGSVITLLGNSQTGSNTGNNNNNNGDSSGDDATNADGNENNTGNSSDNNGAANGNQVSGNSDGDSQNGSSNLQQTSQTYTQVPTTSSTTSPVISKIGSKIPDTGFAPMIWVFGGIAAAAVAVLIVKLVLSKRHTDQ